MTQFCLHYRYGILAIPTQSAVHSYCQCDCHHSIGCTLMSVWVWQGCHTLLQIPILLFLNNMFFCSSVFSKTTCSHVLLSFQTTTCSHVLMSSKQKHVLMFFCLFNNNMFSCSHVFKKNMFSCSHVLKKTCSHVLLSFKKTCSSVFPPKEPCSPSNPVFMSPKKNG